MQLLDRLRSRLDTTDRSAHSTIPPSDVYSLLSNERRRLIIAYLADFDVGEEVECGVVADHLADLGDDRQSAYISIIQQHASRLDASRLVSYDDRAKTLSVCSALHDVHDAHLAVENTLN